MSVDGIQIAFACGTIALGLYTGLQGRLSAEQGRRTERIERHDDENGVRLRDLEMSNVELTQRCNQQQMHIDELSRRVDALEQTSARKREFERMQANLGGKLVNINRAIWNVANGRKLSQMPGADLSGDLEG
jgi:hypothetical protein